MSDLEMIYWLGTKLSIFSIDWQRDWQGGRRLLLNNRILDKDQFSFIFVYDDDRYNEMLKLNDILTLV